MKKVILLILVLSLLLTINVFATTFERAPNDTKSYCVVYKDGEQLYYASADTPIIATESINVGTFYISFYSTVGEKTYGIYKLNSDYTFNSVNRTGTYVGHLSGWGFDSIIASNHDIYKYYRGATSLSTDVFFSQPVNLATEMAKNQQTPIQGILPLIPPMTIMMVGLVGLYKGWSFLKTQLSGA